MWRAAIVLIAGAGVSSPAFAYLDPGVAYAALQPLLVVIAGAFAAIVGYKDRVRTWFKRKTLRQEVDGQPESRTAVESDPAPQSPGSSAT